MPLKEKDNNSIARMLGCGVGIEGSESRKIIMVVLVFYFIFSTVLTNYRPTRD